MVASKTVKTTSSNASLPALNDSDDDLTPEETAKPRKRSSTVSSAPPTQVKKRKVSILSILIHPLLRYKNDV